jgi:hypothetical protein
MRRPVVEADGVEVREGVIVAAHHAVRGDDALLVLDHFDVGCPPPAHVPDIQRLAGAEVPSPAELRIGGLWKRATTARYPHYAFGGFAGMSFGWFSWLQSATGSVAGTQATSPTRSSVWS